MKISRTTCGGYAKLFKEMTRLADIDSEIIYGYSRNYGRKDGSLGTHAWNSVKINSKWYLVDVTDGVRQSFYNGKLTGALQNYKDISLFIHPAIYIRIHFPMETKHQYLTKEVTLDQFKHLPQTSIWLYKYGMDFNDDDFVNRLVKYVESKKGQVWDSVTDRVISQGEIIKIKIQTPKNLKLQVTLNDQSGKEYPSNGTHYQKDGMTVIAFSAPAKGLFTAEIRIKYSETKDSWKRIYEFQLLEVAGTSPDLLQ